MCIEKRTWGEGLGTRNVHVIAVGLAFGGWRWNVEETERLFIPN